jgi:class 3 adenylate cyclase
MEALSSFAVVDAVRCAIEIQNGLIERNAGVPEDRRIEFRVGIHVGDVVEESDGDLMVLVSYLSSQLISFCGRALHGGTRG